MTASCFLGSNGSLSAPISLTPKRLRICIRMRSVAATPSSNPSAFLASGSAGAGLDGPAQIVNDLQQLAGKIRDRVLLGVLRAPFTLTPGIFGLGQRPHRPI